ncbi:MAG: hypothetical protein JKY67_17215 [Pseudomonadales bacterium]|nr:hypothetical protein [Pseudomonadales bacterium]
MMALFRDWLMQENNELHVDFGFMEWNLTYDEWYPKLEHVEGNTQTKTQYLRDNLSDISKYWELLE